MKQTFNEADGKDIISFLEFGKSKKWACRSGSLSLGVVNSIVQRINETTAYQCANTEEEDVIEILCIPENVHAFLFAEDIRKAA